MELQQTIAPVNLKTVKTRLMKFKMTPASTAAVQ